MCMVLYPYVKLGDGTEVLHTQIIEEDGMEKVEVHFERPIENGFMTARFILHKQHKSMDYKGGSDVQLQITTVDYTNGLVTDITIKRNQEYI